MLIFIPKLFKVYYINRIKGVTLQNMKSAYLYQGRFRRHFPSECTHSFLNQKLPGSRNVILLHLNLQV